MMSKAELILLIEAQGYTDVEVGSDMRRKWLEAQKDGKWKRQTISPQFRVSFEDLAAAWNGTDACD